MNVFTLLPNIWNVYFADGNQYHNFNETSPKMSAVNCKKSAYLDPQKVKIKKLPCVYMSSDKVKSCLKEQNEEILLLDFEYREI